MIADCFKLSLLSIKHRKIRSWLTIIGIVIGIAAIISLISISQGLENAVVELFSKLGVQDIRIAPKGLLTGPPTGTSFILTKDDVETVNKVKGVDYVLGILAQRGIVEFAGKKKRIDTLAYPADLAKRAFLDVDLPFAQGRTFSAGEKGSVLLGAKVAEEIFDKEIRLKNKVKVEDQSFKVVGIFEEVGLPVIDNTVFMSVDDARILYGKPEEVSVITAHILQGLNINEVARSIEHKLKRKRDNENFQVFTPQQALEQMKAILGVVGIVLAGIAAISLLVGGIGIMNSMYTSVLERTKNIGVMKAIGATNNHILMMFLVESGLIGLVGGLAGIGLGTGFAFFFGKIASQLGFSLLLIKIDFRLLAFALAFSFLTGVISGTLPAVRASKLKPIDALRYE